MVLVSVGNSHGNLVFSCLTKLLRADSCNMPPQICDTTVSVFSHFGVTHPLLWLGNNSRYLIVLVSVSSSYGNLDSSWQAKPVCADGSSMLPPH